MKYGISYIKYTDDKPIVGVFICGEINVMEPLSESRSCCMSPNEKSHSHSLSLFLSVNS